MTNVKPFAKKYPMSRKEWEDHSYEYIHSKERAEGITFRSYIVRKLGKR